MPCEHHKDALIEAAASGLEPQGELRAHLAACDSCRAAFAEERALFVSIDSGLHASVNADIPPSLLPSVRARLDQQGAPGGSWITNWYVLVSAAVVILAFFAARAVLHTNTQHEPIETVGKTNVPPVTPPSQKQDSVGVPPVEKNQVPLSQFAIARMYPASGSARSPRSGSLGGRIRRAVESSQARPARR
jgi:anti-sigma factor RsiW